MFNVRAALSLVMMGLPIASFGCAAADGQGDTTESEAVESASSMLKSFPPLPSPTLAVPEGNRLAFYFDAIGVQIYACQSTASGFGFTFQAPEASLFDRRGRLVIKHFGGPAWQSVDDGSKVIATKIADFTDDPRSIPELLLRASSHEGKGRMADVTYIQRLETVGGLAPAGGCDADHVGVVARVPYTATYFFYRAAPACK